VHELKEVQGVNGVLDDGQVVKLNDLQVIPKSKEEPTMEPSKVEKVEKQAKVEKVLKSVRIEQGMWWKGRDQGKRRRFLTFDVVCWMPSENKEKVRYCNRKVRIWVPQFNDL